MFPVPAPLLVPLVEEGWLEGDVPRLAVEHYLSALAPHGVDTLVLGCTHYPMLRGLIERVARASLGEAAAVVDSAEATAHELTGLFTDGSFARPGDGPGRLELMVTDRPQMFADIASRFLGHGVSDVEVVDL